MDRIVSNMGDAVILKIERRGQEIEGWERRRNYLGFEGNLIIRTAEDGSTYASIEDGSRCIRTSPGRLTFRGGSAVFETENSIYTFRLVTFGETAVFDTQPQVRTAAGACPWSERGRRNSAADNIARTAS